MMSLIARTMPSARAAAATLAVRYQSTDGKPGHLPHDALLSLGQSSPSPPASQRETQTPPKQQPLWWRAAAPRFPPGLHPQRRCGYDLERPWSESGDARPDCCGLACAAHRWKGGDRRRASVPLPCAVAHPPQPEVTLTSFTKATVYMRVVEEEKGQGDKGAQGLGAVEDGVQATDTPLCSSLNRTLTHLFTRHCLVLNRRPAHCVLDDVMVVLSADHTNSACRFDVDDANGMPSPRGR